MNQTKTGIITKGIGGFYYIRTGEQIYECKARGIFRKAGMTPLVGDRVEISQAPDNTGSIERILPRKNSLIRPPLANIDRLFIVASAASPAINALTLDKLIAIAEHKGIEPVIIFNKIDLDDPSEYSQIYKNCGFLTAEVSCETTQGLEQIKTMFTEGINVLTGNSGVGKSSILNALFEELRLETGAISDKLGRGRHTTRHVELFEVQPGKYIADTPGFSSLDIEKTEVILKEDLPFCFREFAPYLGRCKFSTCSHTCEQGCEVLEALDKCIVSRSRHQSYVTMYNAAKNIKEWEMRAKGV